MYLKNVIIVIYKKPIKRSRVCKICECIVLLKILKTRLEIFAYLHKNCNLI